LLSHLKREAGIDKEVEFLDMSKARKIEIENPSTASLYQSKIRGFEHAEQLQDFIVREEDASYEVESLNNLDLLII